MCADGKLIFFSFTVFEKVALFYEKSFGAKKRVDNGKFFRRPGKDILYVFEDFYFPTRGGFLEFNQKQRRNSKAFF
jgi:hypothetical protein